ncbi:hypothetical protein [Candidatus Tisiphia endosymbiont of Beris chalybata]|uniref:hypothetical protein n=1 Tax=Candidatus Tisiphia endosymbiont of Beris chalybata TaxID=3066262 RepID=UPI00312C839A
MSINKNNINENWQHEKGMKELEGKIFALSGNVLALRIELTEDHRKIESYFRVLTDQLFEMQKNIEFIRAYLDIQVADDEGWEEANNK